MRDHDTIIFEIILSTDLLQVSEKLLEASQIIAPFLVLSQQVIVNLDFTDLKSGLLQSIPLLLNSIDAYNYSKLRL